MATFDLPPQNGAARDAAILAHAKADELDVQWTRLEVGGRIELLVTPDAVKLDGVRINVSATLQQQLADLYGALLFTAKVADLHYAARAVTIPPTPIPITSSTQGMQTVSSKMDAAIASAGGVETGGIVGTVGKHWIITNQLLTNPGKACNLGWYLPAGTKSPWSGIAIYPSPTLSAMLIQQPGFAHDPSHSDDSQQCCLMHRDCTVDGQPADLANVLTDPKLASLVSHEGPLKVPGLRQPGVPVYSCAFQPKAKVMALTDSVTSGMCPLPPPPKNIVSPGRSPWPWVATGLTVATVGALYARHRGWLPLRRS